MPGQLSRIAIESAERATIARIIGEIDTSNADELLRELMAHAGEEPWLIVDLSACSYLDSAALSVIAQVAARCRQVGAGMRLLVPDGGSIDRIFTMTAMDEVLPIDNTLADALTSAGEDPQEPGR